MKLLDRSMDRCSGLGLGLIVPLGGVLVSYVDEYAVDGGGIGGGVSEVLLLAADGEGRFWLMLVPLTRYVANRSRCMNEVFMGHELRRFALDTRCSRVVDGHP